MPFGNNEAVLTLLLLTYRGPLGLFLTTTDIRYPHIVLRHSTTNRSRPATHDRLTQHTRPNSRPLNEDFPPYAAGWSTVVKSTYDSHDEVLRSCRDVQHCIGRSLHILRHVPTENDKAMRSMALHPRCTVPVRRRNAVWHPELRAPQLLDCPRVVLRQDQRRPDAW